MRRIRCKIRRSVGWTNKNKFLIYFDLGILKILRIGRENSFAFALTDLRIARNLDHKGQQ
jgi:hypothetical protein